MEDKNKISDFIRKRLENFDHETEDWETPDSSTRDTILGQVEQEPTSIFSIIKPLHIAAFLLISILGVTSFYFLKNHQESQTEIESIYAELQVKNAEIQELKQKVITLKNSRALTSNIVKDELTTNNSSNYDSIDKRIISKNQKNNPSLFEEALNLKKNTRNPRFLHDKSNSVVYDFDAKYASSNHDNKNTADSSTEIFEKVTDRDLLDDGKIETKDFMISFENTMDVLDTKEPRMLRTEDLQVQRKKNNLFVGVGIQGKSRPFKPEYKFNKKQPMEGQPPTRTKLFYNKYMEVEYMVSDRIGLYTGLGSANAKLTKKTKFDYAFDHKNTVTNSNGEQYNEIEFRSSSNLGDNEGLVSFEVPEGIQNSDKIDVTLSNSFTIKSINIPLGINYYFFLNDKWSSFIGGGLNYDRLYISKYNVKADLAYNSKEVTSKHLLKQPSDKNIQNLNYNLGLGAAYSINNAWSIQGDIQWNKNIYNNGKKHPPKHFDVDAKVGIYYRI